MKKLHGIILIIFMLSQVSVLTAGWVIKQSTTDEDGSVMNETLYFQDNKIKDDTQEQSSVMNLATDQMLMVNHSAKTYWMGSASSMMQESQEAANKQMEEMMANMSPEQREAYQKYMDQMKEQKPQTDQSEKPSVKIVKKDSEATIAGYQATLYEVWSNDEHVEDAWVSEQVPVLKEVDMKKFSDFFEEMAGDDELSYENSPEYRDLLMKGFPLKTVEYSNMGNVVMEVTSVQKESIPNSTFEPPAGYKKVSISDLWQSEPPTGP